MLCIDILIALVIVRCFPVLVFAMRVRHALSLQLRLDVKITP